MNGSILLTALLSWVRCEPAFSQSDPLLGHSVTELHQVCSVEQGLQARCGSGATCLLLGGVPTCHCIRDTATGAAMAGNPYRGCTWDISGKWELFYLDGQSERMYYDGLRNEPYVISIQRTDAVLKTRYITGTIFVITPVTSVSYGIFHRAFVDVNDNRSVILELAEGFVDQLGRHLYFKNRHVQHSLSKVYPSKPFASDQHNLEGGWIKQDGSRVKLHDFHRTASAYGTTAGAGVGGPYPLTVAPGFAYWYNDDSHAIPQMRLATTLFMDETLPFEQRAFDTTNKFIQVGMFAEVALGGGYMVVKSPADGRPIFTFRRVVEYPRAHLSAPPPTTIALSGLEQLQAVSDAAANALGTSATTTTSTTLPPADLPRPPFWPPAAYPPPPPPPNPAASFGGFPFPHEHHDGLDPQKLYEEYHNYGLFNRGVMPNNTFPSPLLPSAETSAIQYPDPRLEVDPYAVDYRSRLADDENSQLVGPPLNAPAAKNNQFDSRREGGARQTGTFYRNLAEQEDLALHDLLRDEALVFDGRERVQSLSGHNNAVGEGRRRMSESNTTVSFSYPEPPSSLCPSDSTRTLISGPADQRGRRLGELSTHEFLTQAGLSTRHHGSKKAVGIVGLTDRYEDDDSLGEGISGIAEASSPRMLEGTSSGRFAEGSGTNRLPPKTTLDDLKKFLPPQIRDNPITQIAASAVENRRGGESTNNRVSLFEENDFFGMELSTSSPYDWLWRASARRLQEAEHARDDALMRRVGKRNSRSHTKSA